MKRKLRMSASAYRSKSVRLTSSAASTGRKKNTPMTSSAGVTSAHAARWTLTVPHPGPRASAASRESRQRFDRAPAPREGCGGSVGTRHGGGHPGGLQLGRQAPLELAYVPGARDIEGIVSASELVPHIGDLRGADGRGPAALEHLDIES